LNVKEFKSKIITLRVWGDNACFTRPEMKVERVSYDVMTPSAARGILEAIHWKPAIKWRIKAIDVLKPIKWNSLRRNEVGNVISPYGNPLFIEDTRQQRAGIFLRDVDYLIHAYFEITPKAGAEDSVLKHMEIFQRRSEKGQCFQRPYLGCREFAAHFELIPQGHPLPEPISKTPDLGFGTARNLGYMLYDVLHDNTRDKGNIHYCQESCRPVFFEAILENGRLKLPDPEEMEVLT